MAEEKKSKGFSKLTKAEKVSYYAGHFDNPGEVATELSSYHFKDPRLQELFDEFSENTVSNYHMPYNIVPGLVLNGNSYTVPMVLEESSVVAAASSAAKFWSTRGGFRAEVLSAVKTGHVHFLWKGDKKKLFATMPELKAILLERTRAITANMEKRGGGIADIELIDKTGTIACYYQLKLSVNTCDSMGANFINSCLEEMAEGLQEYLRDCPAFTDEESECEIIMSILSNYTPDSLVHCWVECDTAELAGVDKALSPVEFTEKFGLAVKIAETDINRAVTHNKGIFNGIDAVAIATGNDFRAIEACGHAWASRSGSYRSLTYFKNEGGRFHYGIYIPMAMGTVGGITGLHPLAKRSLQLMGNPSAGQLMMITTAAGLANNFSAVRALITQGIQRGHMKMHLTNVLNYMNASEEEKAKAMEYFKNRKVSFTAVNDYVNGIRTNKKQENAEK